MAGTANTANTGKPEDRRRSSSARGRVLVVVAVAFTALLAFAAATACLPDLAAIVAPDGALEEGPAPPFRGCGDGIIATLDDGGDAGESCDPGAAAAQADADVPGCTARCQLRCEGTIDPTSGHCYFVAGLAETYGTANAICTAAKAHIVTFASTVEAELVNGQVAPEAGSYWVGLSQNAAFGSAYFANEAEEPGYAPPLSSCSGCFGIGDMGGVFASEVEAGATPCLAASLTSAGASPDRRWLQVPCDGTDGGATSSMRTTICEREPVGARAQDCIGGFCFTVARTAGTKRYLVAVTATDPDTAAQSCAGFDGGSLVVFGSREEREQLAHEIRVRFPDEVDQQLWIGLVEDGGAWAWDDGVVAGLDASRPLPWGNAQPVTVAGARAYMRLVKSGAYDTQLSYADDGKKTPRLYICQRPAE